MARLSVVLCVHNDEQRPEGCREALSFADEGLLVSLMTGHDRPLSATRRADLERPSALSAQVAGEPAAILPRAA